MGNVGVVFATLVVVLLMEVLLLVFPAGPDVYLVCYCGYWSVVAARCRI